LKDIRLSGKIDLIDIDKSTKTLRLTDYKTGKPAASWQGKTDYEKIKLRGYRRQLLFYKLLVENSREFAGWTVKQGIIEFVEPNANGQIMQLTLDHDNSTEEMKEFQRLIVVIWSRIMALDLPDISEFSQNLAGILAFEKSLLKTNI